MPENNMHGFTPSLELFGKTKTDGTNNKSADSIIESPTNASESLRQAYANLDVTAHIKLIRTQGLDIKKTIAEIENQFTKKPSDLPEEKTKNFLKKGQKHSQIGKIKAPKDYIASQMQYPKKSKLPRP
jgi:hypothetical protein